MKRSHEAMGNVIHKGNGKQVEEHMLYASQTKGLDVFVHIEVMKQIMYTDQTGPFLVVSSQGNI